MRTAATITATKAPAAIDLAAGGPTREESVRANMAAVETTPKTPLLHLTSLRGDLSLAAVRLALVLLVAMTSVANGAPRIVVHVPKDRAKCGQLWLEDSGGRKVAGPFTACAKADGATAKKHKNPDRSPLLPYGDTPVGGYRVEHVLKVGQGSIYPERSYGDYAAVRLTPASGEAKLAADIGRTGLLIHGGDPGPGGNLRPTNGCIRLSNRDMRALVEALLLLKDGPPQSCVVEQKVKVVVSEPAPDSGYEEGDPPPKPEVDRPLP